MDILLCVSSSGVLKTIQANSPHLVDDAALQKLWERFVRKEFPYLLAGELREHHESAEVGTASPFPVGTWEELYDKLAIKDFFNLQEHKAQAALSMKAISEAKAQKSALLLDDPRKIIAAKPRGQPGASARATQARGNLSAIQKIAQQTRQLTAQRKQALATAPVPKAPTKASGGYQYLVGKSIRKPQGSLKRFHAIENSRQHGEKLAEIERGESVSPIEDETTDKSVSVPVPDPFPVNITTTTTTTTLSTAKKSLTPPAPAPAPSHKPAKTPTTSGAQKGSEKPAPRKGLNLFQNNRFCKGLSPSRTVERTRRSDGTTITKTWIDWSEFNNRRILSTYDPAKRAAALAEEPVIVTTNGGPAKKRGADAISADDNASAATGTSSSRSAAASSTATAPSVKKAKVAGGVFMPPRRK
ncbi:unnamed protein product [Discula destructiva]